MKELMLSIIVPVYNAERYLEECLLSLFKQDIPVDAYEVIAVDNGSCDSSAAIINRLQTEYPNLRKVTLEVNQLPSGGRNAGLDAAQGKYLMFVDSDDYLYPNVLKSLVEIMDVDNLDFAHLDCDFLIDDKIIKGHYTDATSVVSGIDMYHMNLPCMEVSWSKIYRRSFLNNNHLRFVKGLLFEDDEFSNRMYSFAKYARHIPVVTHVFRKHPYSATQKKVTLSALSSNLVEIKTLYDDLFGMPHIIVDDKMRNDISLRIRASICEIYQRYALLGPDEQKTAKQIMRRTITYRFLPFMSRKRYVLLKLGIIR